VLAKDLPKHELDRAGISRERLASCSNTLEPPESLEISLAASTASGFLGWLVRGKGVFYADSMLPRGSLR
jgi:hypothetical protein